MSSAPSTATRLAGYTLLAWATARRWRSAWQPLVHHAFLHHAHDAGITALPVVGLLAALLGATLVTQLTALAGTDSDLMQRLVFLGLFFELAPLVTALIVVSRSSAAITSELAIMRLHDGFAALRRLRVPLVDYLFLPRILALAVVLPVLALIFQVVAIGSGWLAVALLQNLALDEVAGRFLDLADPLLILASLGKSSLTGALIGLIACYHGSHVAASAEAVSRATIQSVGNGLVAVFIIDGVFAVLLWFIR
jgi:phospholipid/cholesterol/gamma-HCH transport system permease protein